MNTKTIVTRLKARSFSEIQCYVVYLLLLCPFIPVVLILENKTGFFFHFILLFTGFITYTFFEYIAHRFWMHGKENKHPGKSLERHMNHHRHPTELKITTRVRTKLFIANIVLVAASILLNNYFTFFTGFSIGFLYYCFMHVFLHKAWAKKVFPQLQLSHIHHHCKYPDHCFSTCLTFWDNLFNTAVPKENKISDRILLFYFGKDHP